MMKTKKKRRRSQQKMLIHVVINNLIVIACIFIVALTLKYSENINVDDKISTEHESSITENSSNNNDIQVAVEPSEQIEFEQDALLNEIESQYQLVEHETFNSEEKYLLAKIAMAEAEGESLDTKVLVILTVLNRVNSNEFPDTIHDVLFQVAYGVYQFTPVADGRWYNVEPNEDCWEAVKIAQEKMHDDSFDALYFESDPGENWHSMNLTLVCESDSMQFWK